jgi:hypothetical protein
MSPVSIQLATNTNRTRKTLSNWWSRQSKHHNCLGFCGIYNDGFHIFTDYVNPPGTFTQNALRFLSHKEGSIKVGNIEIIHRGHRNGLEGGEATVNVSLGIMQCDIQVPPLHIAYVLDKTPWAVPRIEFLPISRRFLPGVAYRYWVQ